ncbi:MAG: TonB family protein [Sulfurihydrogenibium sp.]|uniref:energy transducer TonB n=1 Tax=Sulfurihydrogenibium sp. TaxID=2053621 RepID=UPI003D0DCED5
MNHIYEEDRKRAFIFSFLFSALVSISFYYIFLVSIHRLSQFSKSEEVIEIVLPSENKVEKPPENQKIVEKQQIKPVEKVQKPKPVHKIIQKPVEEKVKPVEKPQEKPQNQIPSVQPIQSELPKIEDTYQTKPVETPPQTPPKPQENVIKEKDIQKPKTEEKPKQTPQRDEEDQMKKYYQTLYSIIEKNKYYPNEAKRRGEEGTPVVKVTIGEDGKIQDIVLIKSSGSFILDREVINLLKSIGKFPPPPGGKSITVNIAVEYSLGG